MKITLLTRSHLVATLMFSVPLAVLGFRAAAWWGAIAGATVGVVIAVRMMLRGAVEADDSLSCAQILTGPPANALTSHARTSTSDIRALH